MNPEQTQIFKKQTPTRPRADSGQLFGSGFVLGTMCLVGTVYLLFTVYAYIFGLQLYNLYPLFTVASRILPSSSSEDQQVLEGSDVTLVCGATGSPTPKIMWHVFKNSETTRK